MSNQDSKKISDEDSAPLPLTGKEAVRLAHGGRNYQADVEDIAALASLQPAGHRFSVTPAPTIVNPVTDMTWRQVKQVREISPIAPEMQVSFDNFTQDSGSWVVEDGVSDFYGPYGLGFNGGNNNHRNYTHRERLPAPTMFASIKIAGSAQGDYCAASVGFGFDKSNSFWALWENPSGVYTTSNVFIGMAQAGQPFDYGTQIQVAVPPAAHGLGLSMSGGNLTAWIDVLGDDSWYPVVTRDLTDSIFDVNDPAVLAQLRPMFGGNGGTSYPWVIRSFRLGMLGQNFMRDYKPVTLKDGTPYTIGRWHYFTATCDHCAVYRIDFSTYKIEKVGILLANRDGRIWFDLNFTLVFDSDINAWRVLSVNWGDGLGKVLQVRHTIYHGEILHGVHTINVGAPLALTGGLNGVDGCYDASLVWDGGNSRWLISYAVTVNNAFLDFHPRCDYSADLVTFTNIFVAPGGPVNAGGCEGTQVVKIGGKFYVVAGNGSSIPVWSTDTGNLLGLLNLSGEFPTPGGANPPHFIIFQVMNNDQTSYYALSWQNTTYKAAGIDFGHNTTGTPIIFKADQTQVGFEYDVIGAA